MKTKLIFFLRNVLPVFLLLLITLAAYRDVQKNDFIDDFDDNIYVTDNPHINTGLRFQNIQWALTAKVSANWHPATLISHMLDCELFGLDAGKHHLTNLFFHLLNTLLLFMVFKRMTDRHWESFMVAALFAVHPLHVESVAWISERKDVLSTFFWLLTIGFYAWYAKQPSVKRYVPVFFIYLLGIMSKPIVVTLPFALLLIDYWPLNRLDISQISKNNSAADENKTSLLFLVLEKVPLFLLSALSSIITFRFQKYIGDAPSPDIYPLISRVSNALVSYVKYICKLFFPIDLSILYPYLEHIPEWQIIFASLFLLAFTSLVIKAGIRYKFLPVGWFWYLGTLVPVIGLVRVGAQAMADRYMYIPSIGLFLMLVWGIATLLRSWRFKIPFIGVVSAMVLCLLALMAFMQVRHWSNTITLFEHAIAIDPGNVPAHNHLGVTMSRYGLPDETVRHTSESLKKNQDRPVGRRFEDDQLNQTYVKTYTMLGKSLLQKDHIDASIVHFREALLADPDYSEARKGLQKTLAAREREIEEANTIMETLKTDPSSDELYLKLGKFYKRRGQLETAERQYKKAISLNPDNINALMKLAELNAVRGRYDTSVLLYQQAIAFEPDSPEPYYELARIYARRRKIEESVSWLKKAVSCGFNDWDRLKNDKSLQTINVTRYYKELLKD